MATVNFYFTERVDPRKGRVRTGAECSACGAVFFDTRGRKGNDCINQCIQHAKREHASTGGRFMARPSAA